MEIKQIATTTSKVVEVENICRIGKPKIKLDLEKEIVTRGKSG